jgi:hypothetical protein
MSEHRRVLDPRLRHFSIRTRVASTPLRGIDPARI